MNRSCYATNFPLYDQQNRTAQPLSYVDFHFRFKRPTTGIGNSYAAASRHVLQSNAVGSRRRRFIVTSPKSTPEVVRSCAQTYDDVISGVCGDSIATGEVIARRNERERNRVKTINQTFARLRQHLPSSAAASVIRHTVTCDAPSPSPANAAAASAGVTKSKKLSKVQILRAAIHYIGQLQHMLTTTNDVCATTTAIDDDAGDEAATSKTDHPRCSADSAMLTRKNISAVIRGGGRWNRETWQNGTRSNSTIEQRGPWAE